MENNKSNKWLELAKKSIEHLNGKYIIKFDDRMDTETDFILQSRDNRMCVDILTDILQRNGFSTGVTKIHKGKLTLTFWMYIKDTEKSVSKEVQ